MESLAATPRNRQRQIALTACLAVALIAGRAIGGGIVGAPIDLSAFVHEGLLPGGTIFEDTHSVTGALTTPKQSADYRYFASKGRTSRGDRPASRAPSRRRSPNPTATAAAA